MGKLEKKVAVITGAASGIGRATAIRFAGEGAAVVIADLNREGGDAAVRDCKENGGNAIFQLTDVSSEENIKSAVDRAVKEFGRLDIIYNNAGLGGAVGPLEKTSAENWDKTFAILLRAGNFLTCPRFRDTRLTGLRVASCQIGQLVDFLRWLLLLERRIRLVQAGARCIHIALGRLLRERIR